MGPRETPLREEKYMALAFLVAGFSKDPHTQVGSAIVNLEENISLGYGYNGPPSVVFDHEINWARPFKYPWVIHAEINAVKHATQRGYDVKGSTVFVTAMPCKECILYLVDRKVGSVVYHPYLSDDPKSSLNNLKNVELVKEIARKGDVVLRPFLSSIKWMKEWVGVLEEKGIIQ